jgi:hypothetical protein
VYLSHQWCEFCRRIRRTAGRGDLHRQKRNEAPRWPAP